MAKKFGFTFSRSDYYPAHYILDGLPDTHTDSDALNEIVPANAGNTIEWNVQVIDFDNETIRRYSMSSGDKSVKEFVRVPDTITFGDLTGYPYFKNLDSSS